MKKKYPFLILCMSLIISAQGQLSIIIAASNSNNIAINYKSHAGIAYLKSGKVLNGWFKYDYWEFPTYNFKYFSSDSTKQQKVYISDLKEIVLAGSDSALCFRKDSTEFYYLQSYKGLYRKITSGKIEVYDRLINTSEKSKLVGTEILVKYDGTFKKITSIQELDKYIRSLIPEYDKENPLSKQVDMVKLFDAINHYNL